jgi:hypothetical protein
MSHVKPSETIRVKVSDLALFQACVALAFALALERRGLLSRFELADEIEAMGADVPAGGEQLMATFVAALRVPANDGA